jgi:NAD(P)-dependent dehydrogenase (short-subunit alcohol dehydrogenase family)
MHAPSFLVPKDVVDGIVYLLSDCAAMVNGISLPIDGGFTAC